jgi:WD40 repeat protein
VEETFEELADSDATRLTISSDGTRIAFGWDTEIFVWEWTESDAIDVIDIQEQDLPNVEDLALSIRSVVFVGDGSRIVFAIEEGDLFVTTSESVDGTASQAFPSPISAAAAMTTATFVGEEGTTTLLASAHDNGEVKLWTVEDDFVFEIATLLGHDEEALAVGFASNGSLASASWDGDVIWWSAVPEAKLGQAILAPGEARSHPFDVAGVEFVREDLIVSVDGDGLARTWDPQTGELLEPALAEGVSSIDEAGGLLVVGLVDGSMRAVDTDDGSTIEFTAEIDEPVRDVAVSPDGTTIVTVQEAGTVGFWNVATGVFDGFADTPPDLEVQVVLFEPDQLWVGGHINPEDDESYSLAVRLDPATGEVVDIARHNDDETGHVVTSIAVSPDGSTMVTGGTDRRVFVWDLSDLSAATAEWAGHRDAVADVVFLNDGVVLAADLEQRVLMWDVESGRAVGEMSGPTDGVNALDLRPDRAHLIAGGEDDTIWIWDMRIDTWLAGACDLAGRNLTDQEWARFRIGEEPVRHCEQYGPDEWPAAEYVTSDG